MVEPIRYEGKPLAVGTAGGGRIVVQLAPRIVRVRLVGLLFDLMRTFLLPKSLASVRRLKFIYEEHPGAQVLVVGHTDTSGEDAYNLRLSVQRAEAIAAFLSDQVEDWLAWYHYVNQPGEITPKAWDKREDKHMLSHLRDGTGQPFFMGEISPAYSSHYEDAVRRYQQERGLTVDGDAGDETRRALIRDYMAEDDTTLPEGTVLEVHGCGENHPDVPTADSVRLEDNRRVEVFLFEERIDPPPRDDCGPKPGCPEHPRWVGRTGQTVDLRDDMPRVVGAAWEVGSVAEPEELELRLFDRRGRACPECEATLILPSGRRLFATSDAEGVLKVEVPGDVTELTARYTPHTSATLIEQRVTLDLPPVADDAGARGRLQNLGYDAEADVERATFRFQVDRGLEPSGELDAATRARLAELHDGEGA